MPTTLVRLRRSRFVQECLGSNIISPLEIDKLLLQRQYINSFSNIEPGLFITTIHQSKGREFDDVFIVGIENIKNERNLLYVSHSRMKECLNPIDFDFVGSKY